MNSKKTTGNARFACAAAYWLASLALIISALQSRAQCTVDWNDVHQRIDGFGASCAFSGRTWSANTANILFSTNDVGTNICIGLSLLRNQIQPGGFVSTSELGLMQLAQARGARLWSSPWSPQASFNSNGRTLSGIYGGFGVNSTNQAYAAQLANYVKTNAVIIYAVSIQNEPDFTNTAAQPTCWWTAQQIHDFATNLYNAFQASNVTAKIMLPESENWTDPRGLATTAMSDPNSSNVVDIIANHNYVADNNIGDQNPPAVVPNYGKALWETEVGTTNALDVSITNAMYCAGRIHLFLTVPQVNAWHYWWLISGLPDNQGLMGNIGGGEANDRITKRMYVVGQFSRFVRPGYYRIGANNTGTALITAFRETNSSMFAIVAINTNNATDINQTFNLTNFDTASVTPWMTTSNLSLASQSSVAVNNASFTYLLPAMSVVTFVGQASSNSPPTLTPVANRTIGAGFPLQVTNVAADPDLPSQTLTFSLLSGPANATLTKLDATNAVFYWRPLVSQADTTNPVSVVVADSGSPSLSATNNFTVTVNPITNPVVGPVTISGGQVNVMVSGPQGPDYTLLTTTNLTAGWQVLYTTNSPVMPVTLVDTNSADPARFYRIQIGP
ncbi:MAG: hypothetical protein ABSD57_15095 [Verrucomicrobiota bacterium]|jgi:glucuronoarabinoxylan endo-1,4-beta-xylanase